MLKFCILTCTSNPITKFELNPLFETQNTHKQENNKMKPTSHLEKKKSKSTSQREREANLSRYSSPNGEEKMREIPRNSRRQNSKRIKRRSFSNLSQESKKEQAHNCQRLPHKFTS